MEDADARCWFVLRDLKRCNAKLPAYLMLRQLGFEVFTPMVQRLVVERGRRVARERPFMQDLLFARATRATLDPIVRRTETLQYRYIIGAQHTPMTVRDDDMARFIHAVEQTERPVYYSLDEVTPAMRRRPIRIIGGNLDGYEGTLLTTRGSKVKRLLVELPTMLAAAVEVRPEFIQLM